MIRSLMLAGFATMAVSACGQGVGNDAAATNAATAGNTIAAPQDNAVEPLTPRNEAGNSDDATVPAAADEPRSRAVDAYPKATRTAQPRPPTPKTQPKENEPDPHAGHDMNNMSH